MTKVFSQLLKTTEGFSPEKYVPLLPPSPEFPEFFFFRLRFLAVFWSVFWVLYILSYRGVQACLLSFFLACRICPSLEGFSLLRLPVPLFPRMAAFFFPFFLSLSRSILTGLAHTHASGRNLFARIP